MDHTAKPAGLDNCSSDHPDRWAAHRRVSRASRCERLALRVHLTRRRGGLPCQADQRCKPRSQDASADRVAIFRRRHLLKCYELQGPSGIDGLTLVDKPVAQPGQGQVLVRLKTATLNYRDLLMIKGGYGARQKFPLVPLSDGAGVIEAVGSCVREFAVGGTISKPLVVSIPHRLGKDEALRRLKNGLGSASANFGHVFKIQEEIWTGPHLQSPPILKQVTYRA